jgi:hypothetical protein
MMSENVINHGLKEITDELTKMVCGETEPYRAGWIVWSKAFSLLKESPNIFGPLWLIWGSMTDWAEQKPKETGIANETMLRAAEEWVSINTEKSRMDYYIRWCNELGIEGYRPGSTENKIK